MGLQDIDYAVLGLYAVMLVAIAWWVSREKKGHAKDTADYFLASKALPWWAIGASLIAANISAEQVIGMSGSGYAIGLAIASYEWMSALTLIIVGKYFLPIFLQHRIYTMPQFLEQRYDGRVRAVMAVFWLGVYTFVNLTSVMWLGALAITQLTGVAPLYGIVALAAFAAIYSLYGGLKAVALTDIIQVAMLVAGGLIIAYITLDAVSDGHGAIAGFFAMMERAPDKFDMILSRDNPQYQNLPGIGVLVGGMWIMNLSYWGFNQYIIQRALGAKDVREAQAGIVFAAFLKLLVPVLVVFPGIAAFLLAPQLDRPDQAYPEMMKLAPVGLKGLIFAALVAAIVSSLASMVNSIATIFTIDLFKPMRPQTSETALVWLGRGVAFTALVIAVIAAQPLLGRFEQAFQYIQNFTGFFTPPIVALFLLGMFWKRMTANAALATALGGAAASAGMFYLNERQIFVMPFMDRVGAVFLFCVALGVLVSLLADGKTQAKAIHHEQISFKTSARYNLAFAIISAVLIAIYWRWW